MTKNSEKIYKKNEKKKLDLPMSALSMPWLAAFPLAVCRAEEPWSRLPRSTSRSLAAVTPKGIKSVDSSSTRRASALMSPDFSVENQVDFLGDVGMVLDV